MATLLETVQLATIDLIRLGETRDPTTPGVVVQPTRLEDPSFKIPDLQLPAEYELLESHHLSVGDPPLEESILVYRNQTNKALIQIVVSPVTNYGPLEPGGRRVKNVLGHNLLARTIRGSPAATILTEIRDPRNQTVQVPHLFLEKGDFLITASGLILSEEDLISLAEYI